MKGTDGATDDLIESLEPERYRLLPNTFGKVTRRARSGSGGGARPRSVGNELAEARNSPRSKISHARSGRDAARHGRFGETGIHRFALRPRQIRCCGKQLEEAGAAAVMPLGAPIGSNRGLESRAFLEIIIAQSRVPVVVDAGLGVPSHAAAALEMGADAVLVNTAIAAAADPIAMAAAFRHGVEAGRLAFEAGAPGGASAGVGLRRGGARDLALTAFFSWPEPSVMSFLRYLAGASIFRLRWPRRSRTRTRPASAGRWAGGRETWIWTTLPPCSRPRPHRFSRRWRDSATE